MDGRSGRSSEASTSKSTQGRRSPRQRKLRVRVRFFLRRRSTPTYTYQARGAISSSSSSRSRDYYYSLPATRAYRYSHPRPLAPSPSPLSWHRSKQSSRSRSLITRTCRVYLCPYPCSQVPSLVSRSMQSCSQSMSSEWVAAAQYQHTALSWTLTSPRLTHPPADSNADPFVTRDNSSIYLGPQCSQSYYNSRRRKDAVEGCQLGHLGCGTSACTLLWHLRGRQGHDGR